MVAFSIARHLLSDTESLHSYSQSQVVSFDDVRRRLLLLERATDRMVPDQFYRLKLERDLNTKNNLSQLLVEGLSEISDDYLYAVGNTIYITNDKQNDWQEMITYLPPLLLKMAFLYRNVSLTGRDQNTLCTYFENNILPNTKYTCLPSADIPDLNNLVYTSQGLHDLHIHLNGSTEIDIAWQDFLSFPDKIYDEFNKAIHLPMVKEQLEQESSLLEPRKFCDLLRIARRIRSVIFERLFPSSSIRNYSLESILKDLNTSDSYSRNVPDSTHPFLSILKQNYNLQNNAPIEGLMYILIFDELNRNSNSTLTSLFHYYLLILGLSNRLIVQQVHQKGFQQFQKITLNNLREHSEVEFHNRFFQMHGNEKNILNFLEGRFSPKKTEAENIAFIEAIYKGWKFFKKETFSHYSAAVPDLKLVAHFIKRQDDKPDPFIRHKNLRDDIYGRGRALFLLLKNSEKYRKLIVGIDAAASEFDTPPEVFAPTFRYLRERLIEIGKAPHFTYHVGEDFYHLIDGMRAIYEAIEFLHLSKNDRIGHGTALGISVLHWKKMVGDSIMIRKGEWLDNLIFMWSITKTNSNYPAIQSNLETKIQELANYIYDPISPILISDLERAWLAREYCPTLLSCIDEQEAKTKVLYNQFEWHSIQLELLPHAIKNIISLYHTKDVRKKYHEPITVKVDEIFSLNYLEETQIQILSLMGKKQICIETLPTSNVRIGNYKNFDDYHLNNWVEFSKLIKMPKIVVGTDDTGIFATNIYNEYSNLWQYFVKAKGKTALETLTLINELNANSVNYKFLA